METVINKKNIYEIINPSDEVTFVSDSDKVAYACAIIVGKGAYGCTNLKTQESLGTLLLFVSADVFEKQAAEFLEESFADFIQSHRKEIKESLLSFAYCSAQERTTFDDAVSAITEPDKLKAFKEKHDDRNRSSMNQICNNAWAIAESIQNQQS